MRGWALRAWLRGGLVWVGRSLRRNSPDLRCEDPFPAAMMEILTWLWTLTSWCLLMAPCAGSPQVSIEAAAASRFLSPSLRSSRSLETLSLLHTLIPGRLPSRPHHSLWPHFSFVRLVFFSLKCPILGIFSLTFILPHDPSPFPKWLPLITLL